MTDRSIRTLDATEIRSANTLFRATLHEPPAADDVWQRSQRTYQAGRTLGAFENDTLIGTARSIDTTLTVPGGAVPMAAVTGVGVRADRTRRGVLTDLMATQLTDCAERGVPVAGLHASEAVIYGRYGYGIATHHRSRRVTRHRAEVRSSAPTDGEVELYDLDTALTLLPDVYARVAHSRSGMLDRTEHFWPMWEGHFRKASGLMRLAVHHGSDGPDGYAAYRAVTDNVVDDVAVMHIEDMAAATPAAYADLWRALLRVDLITRVESLWQPLDVPLEALLTDHRAVATTGVEDDLWLRLVDVPAALNARTYGGGDDAVVLEVSDPVLKSNSGRYRLSASGCSPTSEPAQLALGVDTLGMLYLGGWRVADLVAVGRIEITDASTADDVLGAAHRLLVTDSSPWCGTFF
ncbi:GNAT family N-acetyltransferase [Haloechinothrix salitolerans]|uniref:GNAT family N-acetyltransferase n=1 Tax=Haloechinothrix salitolerans TaxID=926830 RepID=A0ABW2C086_9PSEU